MKKFLVLVFAFVILANCKVKVDVNGAKAGTGVNQITQGGNVKVHSTRITEEGMDFLIIYGIPETSQGGSGVSVVNLTKDKLEVELLRKQLEQYVN